MTTQRRLLILVASLLAAAILAACAGSQAQTPALPASADPDEAPVSEVEVLRLAGEPLDLRLVVRGTLPDACLRTGEPVVERRSRLFEVRLPVTRAVQGSCPVGPLAYEQVVRLPAESLAPGRYTLLVDGSLFSFELADLSMERAAALPAALPTVVLAQQAVTPAPAEATPAPVETALPTATGAATRTPVVLGGQDPDDCHKAALYGEPSIKPGALFDPAEGFTMVWKVRNEGTCAWDENYALVRYDGEDLGTLERVPVPPAAPGEIVDISAQMVAPIPAGVHQGSWVIAAPNGYVFGTGGAGLYPLVARIITRALQPDVLPLDLQCGAERQVAQEREVYELINAERAIAGLNPVEWEDAVTHVAANYSFELACYDRWIHQGRDGFLYPVRLQRGGVLFETSNEMIYAGNGGPKGAVKWWLESSTHRPIMLSDRYTKIGVGYVVRTSLLYQQRVTVNFIAP